MCVCWTIQIIYIPMLCFLNSQQGFVPAGLCASRPAMDGDRMQTLNCQHSLRHLLNRFPPLLLSRHCHHQLMQHPLAFIYRPLTTSKLCNVFEYKFQTCHHSHIPVNSVVTFEEMQGGFAFFRANRFPPLLLSRHRHHQLT